MTHLSSVPEFAAAAARYEQLAVDLAEAARVLRPQLFRPARRAAIALATACDNQMLPEAVDIVTEWTAPDGTADARTYVLVDELLLVAAEFAVYPFRRLRLPTHQFPTLRVADDGTQENRRLNVAAGLISATVRGEVRTGTLTLAAHLNTEQPARAVQNFVLAVVVMTRAAAGLAGVPQGLTPADVLTRAGLAAAR